MRCGDSDGESSFTQARLRGGDGGYGGGDGNV